MAGTIALSLQQQFDRTTGSLLAGGKLYFYQAGTLTPQNAYEDSGLSRALPNPVTLESDARVPQLYFADGLIRVRLTNNAGTVQFDEDAITVIGASSGGGGGGGGTDTTDPNAIFQTGDSLWLNRSGARTGWIIDNATTIGSASSGASQRANADVLPLFTYLWQTYSDAQCPVVGGRGASAAADWAANKPITTFDMRGRLPCGLDTMGGSASNRLSGVTFATGNANTVGSTGGAARHTLTDAETPVQTHTATVTDPGHAHSFSYTGLQVPGVGLGGGNAAGGVSPTSSTSAATTGITVAVSSHGGGQAHEIMNPFVLGTWYRKL